MNRQHFQLFKKQALKTACVVLTLTCAASSARAQWPFNDAPQRPTLGVAQTSNLSSLGPASAAAPRVGVIMSADSLDLGPGEQVIDGDPILKETGIVKGNLARKLQPMEFRMPTGRKTHGRFGPRFSYDCYTGCPTGCPPAVYGGFEALYLENDNDPFPFSSGFVSDTLDGELAGRITIGRMRDCASGYEAVFTGMPEWEEMQTATGAGNLAFRLGTTAPFNAASLSTFYNADFQSQAFSNQYTSLEVNRKTNGWDVISSVFGMKAIVYDEEFAFLTRNAANQFGQFNQSADNFLIGMHAGLDLRYPLGRRLMVGTRGRAGLYLNLSDVTTNLANNGTVLISHGNDDTDIAANIEYGIYSTYHLMPCLALKAGYEFWWMTGVASIDSNLQPLVSPNYGLSSDKDEVLIHGALVGVEVIF